MEINPSTGAGGRAQRASVLRATGLHPDPGRHTDKLPTASGSQAYTARMMALPVRIRQEYGMTI